MKAKEAEHIWQCFSIWHCMTLHGMVQLLEAGYRLWETLQWKAPDPFNHLAFMPRNRTMGVFEFRLRRNAVAAAWIRFRDLVLCTIEHNNHCATVACA